MRRSLILSILCTSLIGCASPASKKEIDDATEAYTSCFISTAEKFDDQKSSAADVASGIVGLCGSELKHAEAVVAQGLSFNNYQQIQRRMDAFAVQIATAIVLKERAFRVEEEKKAAASGVAVPDIPPPSAADGAFQDALTAYQKNDDITAFRIFHSLADKGNASAQGMLGLMYFDGRGAAQDYVEGVRWTRKAADQGSVSAQELLGLMYFNGKGVTKDYSEAAKWWRKAADQGSAGAQRELTDLRAQFPELESRR